MLPVRGSRTRETRSKGRADCLTTYQPCKQANTWWWVYAVGGVATPSCFQARVILENLRRRTCCPAQYSRQRAGRVSSRRESYVQHQHMQRQEAPPQPTADLLPFVSSRANPAACSCGMCMRGTICASLMDGGKQCSSGAAAFARCPALGGQPPAHLLCFQQPKRASASSVLDPWGMDC